MSCLTTIAGLLLFVAGSALAQTEAPATEFEVASIKPFVPPPPQGGRGVAFGGRRGGPGTNDPSQITWNGTTLKNVIMTAYGVKNYQVSGPPWLDTERYTIAAKVPPGTTKEQVLVMWQNLLAERFRLKLHRETKEIPIYEITVAKNGPKLKESEPDPPPPKDPPAKPLADAPSPFSGRLTTGPDGCPVLPGGRGGTMMMMMPGRFRVCAKKTSIENLTNMLTNQLSRPVFDKTGLKGMYDFKLEFEPESQMGMMAGPVTGGAIASASQSGPPPEGSAGVSSPNQETAPPISAAFQNQLGLKLEAKKAPADMLIIDTVEKTPTDN